MFYITLYLLIGFIIATFTHLIFYTNSLPFKLKDFGLVWILWPAMVWGFILGMVGK